MNNHEKRREVLAKVQTAISTGYYQSKKLDPAKHLVVQTSIGNPRWGAKAEWETELITPTPEVLELADSGEMAYTKAYVAQLEKIGVPAIRAELEQLTKAAAGREVVLCCFEALKKHGQFCHRRIFAWWWHTKTGETIGEL
ncbi:MAG: hypothetical protein JWR19_2182 [Pedosphaera sp.]|nr:hypothetical protein [Pedosphaera sp.]